MRPRRSWCYGTESGSDNIDAFLLKMPIFGILIRKVAVAHFTRTLGTLISSGVAILDGLGDHRPHRGQQGGREGHPQDARLHRRGQDHRRAAEASDVFPPMVVQMIAVGEQTGALDEMLSKIADFYDEEVDTAVENLTALLEPMIMVFLGVVIGGVVIAMYLPIFKLVTVVGN